MTFGSSYSENCTQSPDGKPGFLLQFFLENKGVENITHFALEGQESRENVVYLICYDYSPNAYLNHLCELVFLEKRKGEMKPASAAVDIKTKTLP